jgi:hypothetical protein
MLIDETELNDASQLRLAPGVTPDHQPDPDVSRPTAAPVVALRSSSSAWRQAVITLTR